MEPKNQFPKPQEEESKEEKYKKVYDYFPTGMDPLASEDMREFLVKRKIEEKDIEKIKDLIAIMESDPEYQNFITHFHNAFIGQASEWKIKDKLRMLEIEKAEVEEKKERLPQNVEDFYDIFIYFLEKYGLGITHRLERFMEDLPRKMEEELEMQKRIEQYGQQGNE